MAKVDLTVNAPGVSGAVAVPAFQSMPRRVNGQFSLTVNGNIGQSYNLLASTDLIHWTNVITFVCTNSSTEVFDPASLSYPKCFYRISP